MEERADVPLGRGFGRRARRGQGCLVLPQQERSGCTAIEDAVVLNRNDPGENELYTPLIH